MSYNWQDKAPGYGQTARPAAQGMQPPGQVMQPAPRVLGQPGAPVPRYGQSAQPRGGPQDYQYKYGDRQGPSNEFPDILNNSFFDQPKTNNSSGSSAYESGLYLKHGEAVARCEAGDPRACGEAAQLEAAIEDLNYQKQLRRKTQEEEANWNKKKQMYDREEQWAREHPGQQLMGMIGQSHLGGR